MTRVMFVDDHPALRAGLATVLRSEPGITVVASASRTSDALHELKRSWPEVVLADYQLPDGDGLALCQRLKATREAPAVLLYSAYSSGALAMAALVAGADGLVSKAAPADELGEAIRTVARGEKVFPDAPPAAMEEAAASLGGEYLPIFGMLSSGTPRAEVADVLALSENELAARTSEMLDRLRALLPGGRPGAG